MIVSNEKSNNYFPVQVCSLDKLAQFNITKIVAAIGVFDGIHLGHREVIKELIKMSNEQSATPVVITFFPHPRKVLFPGKPLLFLRTPVQKAKILGGLGIKAIVTVPFTLEFASLSSNQFIEKFMRPHNIKLTGICVGTKWKFGAGAKGNEQTLHDFANKYGFVFKSVKETYWNGKPVSSTSTRQALSAGDFSSANYMLGMKYILSGHFTDFCKPDGKSIKVKIDYGVLPPAGYYTAYLNNNRNKKIVIEVISQSELKVNSSKPFSIGRELEIELIKKN
jgi:riboflavin kinase / FMN adenylyltransferase